MKRIITLVLALTLVLSFAVFPASALYRAQESGHIRETEKRIPSDGQRRQYMVIT